MGQKTITNQSTSFGARGVIFAQASRITPLPNKARKRGEWVTTKSAFPALGGPLARALAHGSPHVEGVALLKFVESGNFSLNKLVIRRVSV